MLCTNNQHYFCMRMYPNIVYHIYANIWILAGLPIIPRLMTFIGSFSLTNRGHPLYWNFAVKYPDILYHIYANIWILAGRGVP